MGNPLEKQEIAVLILIGGVGLSPPPTPYPGAACLKWLVRRAAERQLWVRILPCTPPLIYAENPKRFKL